MSPVTSLNAAAAETEEELVAILNDTHIGAKQKLDSPIPTHLAATVDYLVNLEKLMERVPESPDASQAGLAAHGIVRRRSHRKFFRRFFRWERRCQIFGKIR